MSDAGSETASNVEQVEQVEQVADNSGPMSVEDALQEVIKVSRNGQAQSIGLLTRQTALIHDGLARGLRESAKALDKREAHLCVLVETVTEGEFEFEATNCKGRPDLRHS